MMHLDQLLPLIERLRVEAIGAPDFVPEIQAYVYKEQSAKVVAILKIVRATQGLSAMKLLCQSGLFIDFGVTIRCVYDCIDEVYFLLEGFPNTSANVDKFVKGFFESAMTINGHRSQTTPAVETAKIRSARVRYLKGSHDEVITQLLARLYKTFSGYVHANCAQIMETFGGPARNFNLAGIPSVEEQQKRMEHVDLAINAVLQAASFAAHTLNLTALYQDLVRSALGETS
ncbi:MAG: hypothetical protein EPN75_06870 [Beijerinckiaceae bacterium]|nr:MAG: hypothetical protein EPN75_06870 [Beijerinckiaceae bacterium]